ncbi:hypothetical protein GGS21DRAFT_487048 [Xylaria nigripes]|nr:hypothetical protein GGS21DRAFT_487048 [Xylaria nigripes]
MAKSRFQEWWRAQLNDSRNDAGNSPVCPCASCFNGTRDGPANERSRPKREQKSLKTLKVLRNRRCSASDLVPLCSNATWSSRSSLDSDYQIDDAQW